MNTHHIKKKKPVIKKGNFSEKLFEGFPYLHLWIQVLLKEHNHRNFTSKILNGSFLKVQK